MNRESTKVTVMSRWPLYKSDCYGRFDYINICGLFLKQFSIDDIALTDILAMTVVMVAHWKY